jgi:hypothetical protein
MASVSGGTSFCTQNGFYQNYPARKASKNSHLTTQDHGIGSSVGV